MVKGFLHLHTTAVVLFLLLFTVKTVLLLLGKTEALEKLRAKTKILDMVFGTLMLATGIALLLNIPEIKAYHYVKIVVAAASIPVGIIAFKKSNKAMAVGLLVVFIYVFGVAETKSLTFSKPKIEIPAIQPDSVSTPASILDQNSANVAANGEVIYKAACTACHGLDGKLGVGDAKDLTASTLSHAEKVAIITKGKGLMNSFKGQLSDAEIEAVATYVDGMKK
ncbi:MAG: SirB2 family protein [Cytophagaceae bacterium]|nr:SirB2 family protein [Cytophagaceae bacterium]